MILNKLKSAFSGASGDSFFLIFVRLITMAFGILMTKLLSEHFTKYEYGTYQQILLIQTFVSGLTTLGMVDGINFFFCREKDEKRRDEYVATIFALQYAVCSIAAVVIILCATPIAAYFKNDDVKKLILLAATLPALQNLITMLQVMFLAIGKAKLIAMRNLVVSILKLGAIAAACYLLDNVAFVLVWQVILDLGQIVYFYVVLKKNGCSLNVLKFNPALVKETLFYCVPMGMFTVVRSLNRDCDKLVVSAFTDTETLAVFANASKLLPFDVIMMSFCTVLLPYVTRFITSQKLENAANLYRSFLSLSYVSTTIFAFGAVCVAPELMRFLYGEKYLSGLSVFIPYLFVEMFGVLTLTLVLSAAGKTTTIMYVALGALIAKYPLTILFYLLFGWTGPAFATLAVTIVQGFVTLRLGCKTLKTNVWDMLSVKTTPLFIAQLLVCGAAAFACRTALAQMNVYYFVNLTTTYFLFVGAMFALNYRRLRRDVAFINRCKMNK